MTMDQIKKQQNPVAFPHLHDFPNDAVERAAIDRNGLALSENGVCVPDDAPYFARLEACNEAARQERRSVAIAKDGAHAISAPYGPFNKRRGSFQKQVARKERPLGLAGTASVAHLLQEHWAVYIIVLPDKIIPSKPFTMRMCRDYNPTHDVIFQTIAADHADTLKQADFQLLATNIGNFSFFVNSVFRALHRCVGFQLAPTRTKLRQARAVASADGRTLPEDLGESRERFSGGIVEALEARG